MAMHTPVEKFFELVGHDGSEILNPALPEPQGRRGFHAQEAVDVAWMLGYSVTPFELFPQSLYRDGSTSIVQLSKPHWVRFNERVYNGIGVIECVTKQGNGHAVANDFGFIYDPDSTIYAYRDLEWHGLYQQRFWQLVLRSDVVLR